MPMENLSQLDDLVRALGQDLGTPAMLWQLVIIATCVTAGWLASWRLKPRLTSEDTLRWKLGRGGLARVAFPLFTLVFVLIARAIYGHGHPKAILNLTVSLVTAFALVRLAVYMLRHVFPPNPLLKASERFIALMLWGWMALYITGAHQAVGSFLREDLAFKIGKVNLSALDVVQGVGAIVVTLVVAMWLARLLESRRMGQDHIDMSFRVVMSKFFRALLLLIAVLIALQIAGIDFTLLSVFSGALGVGLGFGLQKVASNYVSGFIILLDRSIRPGDLITADNRYGTVSQMNTRYTVVRSLDGSEAIIPNDTLMTTTVINHSYSDHRLLLKLVVQVSYASPLKEVLTMLAEAAASQPRVLKDPAPSAGVTGFGESGIDLELFFWIGDPENGQSALKSGIYLAIWQAFQQHGVEIPYPQRELRVTNSLEKST